MIWNALGEYILNERGRGSTKGNCGGGRREAMGEDVVNFMNVDRILSTRVGGGIYVE